MPLVSSCLKRWLLSATWVVYNCQENLSFVQMRHERALIMGQMKKLSETFIFIGIQNNSQIWLQEVRKLLHLRRFQPSKCSEIRRMLVTRALCFLDFVYLNITCHVPGAWGYEWTKHGKRLTGSESEPKNFQLTHFEADSKIESKFPHWCL